MCVYVYMYIVMYIYAYVQYVYVCIDIHHVLDTVGAYNTWGGARIS